MMSVTAWLLTLVVIVNVGYAIQLITDIIKHQQQLKNEKANSVLLAFTSPIIFFFSSLGISDFILSTILYRKLKLVNDKILPGTLNTQCVIPVAVMALAFISTVEVDMLTLIVCIISQVIGAYLGPRLVLRLSTQAIRRFIGIGLIMTTGLILASKFNLLSAGGTAIGLTYDKLAIAAVCLGLFGTLNCVGIGSYAPTLVTIYALGMNPAAAFPIMMGASTFSVPIGSTQFIKYGLYSRKITIFASTVGVLGVLAGVSLVKQLDVSNLQWVVAAIVFYSGVSMLLEEMNVRKAEVLA